MTRIDNDWALRLWDETVTVNNKPVADHIKKFAIAAVEKWGQREVNYEVMKYAVEVAEALNNLSAPDFYGSPLYVDEVEIKYMGEGTHVWVVYLDDQWQIKIK